MADLRFIALGQDCLSHNPQSITALAAPGLCAGRGGEAGDLLQAAKSPGNAIKIIAARALYKGWQPLLLQFMISPVLNAPSGPSGPRP